MNEQKDPREDFSSNEKKENIFGWLNRYKKPTWNLILFFTGVYLVWKTIFVCLMMLGFLTGTFFIFLSLNELGLLKTNTVLVGLTQLFRSK